MDISESEKLLHQVDDCDENNMINIQLRRSIRRQRIHIGSLYILISGITLALLWNLQHVPDPSLAVFCQFYRSQNSYPAHEYE